MATNPRTTGVFNAVSSPTTTTTYTGNVQTYSPEQYAQEMIKAQQAAREAATPGATAVAEALSGQAQQLSAGQLPTDVINLIGQRAAERGISGGNVTANYLKDLGLTSLQAIQQGAGIYGTLSATPTADVSQAAISPYQQSQLQLESQRLAQQQAEALRQYQLQQRQLQMQEEQWQQQLALQRAQQRQLSQPVTTSYKLYGPTGSYGLYQPYS